MLVRFEVRNFKGFNENVVFDLSAGEYSYNRNLIQNSVVRTGIIYGKNGVGKSSLGIAIFDITRHLADKQRMPDSYLENYRNLQNPQTPVSFVYEFLFGKERIKYEYQKSNPDTLGYEKLTVNSKILLDWNFNDAGKQNVDASIAGSLNFEHVDNRLSILKYINRNTPSNPNSPVTKLIHFCEKMLWYRSLSEGDAYAGFTNGHSALLEKLYQSGELEAFEQFLSEFDLHYSLRFEEVNGTHELYVLFNNGRNKAQFLSIASTGTKTLLLFYVWKISAFRDISFLFIDEFDAFLHYEASERLLEQLGNCMNFQTIITTHNTNLMTNRITRPDCCFVMTKNKITSLANATDRELREGHNLQKLYLSGEFNG